MCDDEPSVRHRRYANDILALHARRSFREMLWIRPDECTYHKLRSNGLLTLGMRTSQLDPRHLLGLQGFRLAEYLRLGWVCEQVIASKGMLCEPVDGLRPDDMHMVTLSADGRIVGSLSLVGSQEGAPLDLRDPHRPRFSVETIHGIDLIDFIDIHPARTTAQVREVTRFVHRRSMSADRMMRLRVTLELLQAAQAILVRPPAIEFVIGDAEDHVALRHLMLSGLRTRVVEGTHPRLSNRHYLHPAYTKRRAVKPFVAEVDTDQTARRMERFDEVLSSDDLSTGVRSLLADSLGTTERIAARPDHGRRAGWSGRSARLANADWDHRQDIEQ